MSKSGAISHFVPLDSAREYRSCCRTNVHWFAEYIKPGQVLFFSFMEMKRLYPDEACLSLRLLSSFSILCEPPIVTVQDALYRRLHAVGKGGRDP